MIIICNNCTKKFNVDPSYIPKTGRLLKCGSCDHKWFFKINDVDILIEPNNIDVSPKDSDLKIEEQNKTNYTNSKNIELLEKKNEESSIIKKSLIEDNTDKNDLSKNKTNYNLLGLTIVLIISFIAIIIILDTFQVVIAKFLPNIEFILYNLYETINDISLFLKDLI